MRLPLLVVAAFLAAQGGPFTQADQIINEAEKVIPSLERCLSTSTQLQQDLDRKRHEIKAKHSGQIPASYDNLLSMKANRAKAQSELCGQFYKTDLFDRAMIALQGVEPKSLPGFEERKNRIADIRERFNNLLADQASSAPPQPRTRPQRRRPQSR